MKLFSLFFLAFIAVSLISPSDAIACACCAEPGTYVISTKKPEKLEFDELKKIRFASAKLFMTAAGEDNISGISSIGEVYSLNGLLQSNAWKLNFKDDKSKAGTLNLMKPTSMVSYMADIHDSRKDSETVLYKEWRFKYKVQSGTGIFQNGIATATEYFLVLQGRGNACTQAEDFTHWRVEITGKKAKYAFYGELNSRKTTRN